MGYCTSSVRRWQNSAFEELSCSMECPLPEALKDRFHGEVGRNLAGSGRAGFTGSNRLAVNPGFSV